MQEMTMSAPITRGQDLQNNNVPCLHNLNLFNVDIQKMYSGKDKRLNLDTRLYCNCLQGYWNIDEIIQTYRNRLRRNQREAE